MVKIDPFLSLISSPRRKPGFRRGIFLPLLLEILHNLYNNLPKTFRWLLYDIKNMRRDRGSRSHRTPEILPDERGFLLKQRLFKSIFLVAMAVFLMSVAVFTVLLSIHMNDANRLNLQNEAALAAAAAEHGGVAALEALTLPDCRIQWTDAGGALRLDTAPGEADSSQTTVTLSDGSTLTVSNTGYTLSHLLLQSFTPLLFVAALAVGLSAVLASRAARSVTEPLNRIDFSRPDERDVEEELKPVVRRLAEQNRQIRRQMEDLNAEHDRQDRLRREFTANVSHELKTPLTSIIGFAELIRDGLARPEDVERFAGKICDEGKRLMDLVGDILRLSRLEERGQMLSLEPLSLYQEAELVTDQLASEAARRQVTISLTCSRGEIVSSRKIVAEILHNLVDNAVKYNRPGGTVTVTVSEGTGEAALSVADTGIGIPQEELPRIFERFYRVDKSHSRELGGTGLGLSIVKHGAACLGAKLSVESTLDVGTTITVTFPQEFPGADAPKNQIEK